MESKRKQVHVLIVSDATGMTAERVISAALVQFAEIRPIYKKYSHIQRQGQIDAVLNEAETLDAIVIHSLVKKELRSYIAREKRQRKED